jgi:hypothetical protein
MGIGKWLVGNGLNAKKASGLYLLASLKIVNATENSEFRI